MVGYASRETLRFAVIGLVTIAAISVAAASVTTVTQIGGGDSPGALPAGNGTFGGEGPGGGGEGFVSEGGGNEGQSVRMGWCNELLRGWAGTVGYFLAFGLVLYGAKRRYNLGTALLAFYGLSPFVLVTYFVNTDCATLGNTASGEGGASGPVEGLISTQAGAPEVSPLVLVAVLGVVLVGTAAVLLRASGDQAVAPTEDGEDDPEQPDVADLAAAAGRAADRMEEHNADVDNEVYRAWWQMTRLLDVADPETATPGEFAGAAVDVGMDAEDVGRLTTLFEEVRYGERDAESREALAIEVFRNIEEAYGDDGGVGASSGDGGEAH